MAHKVLGIGSRVVNALESTRDTILEEEMKDYTGSRDITLHSFSVGASPGREARDFEEIHTLGWKRMKHNTFQWLDDEDAVLIVNVPGP